MVNIMSGLRDNKVKNMRFFLNYPKIEVNDEDEEVQEFAEIVNKSILNEINIFEEVVIYTYHEENIIGNINAISEYNVAFNKGNIISVPMEFSQIIGLTDISHMYSYNYDFNLMKRITLEDLFKKDVDFEKVIQNYIMEEVYEILDKYASYITYDIYELMMESIYICDDPVFYFNGIELVICISSFELTSQVCNLIEFPISFKKLKNILSDYALKNIILY
ncbi:hypothetical protein [Intestinibacter bartlettii]|uniref:DUF3298 domain-containing protein n=1 Tax=Intestinibacter bartlettii TaxID=261299 RepID=A0ABS6DXJ2_9FIRM|nr:hypothetical protein [Intestinibacter bartlettii]MBU5336534.1 hypothetical protein [Intestinibacter bartlettii]MDO5009661.1 hypothetical protein [Intestinibacter bartlettii]